MKRILSAALSVILLVTCVGINLNSIIGASTTTPSSDPDDKLITVFDSNAYVTTDSATTNVNSAIKTESDKGLWLGGNSWLSDNTARQDGLYMGAGGETAKILERNGAAIVDAGNFEWQFQISADNAETVNTSFVFHINDKSDISGYNSRNNVFAVTLYGSGYTEGAARFQLPNALVIEYSNGSNNNGMRPYAYDTAVTPWKTNPNSYIKLDDSSAAKAISLSAYITVNVKMEGRKITVSSWQSSDKENTLRTQSVTISGDAIFNRAVSGDFAIVSGASTSNYRVKDMQLAVDRTVLNSANYTNQINTAISDTALWFAEGWAGSNKTRMFLNHNDNSNSSGAILTRNTKVTNVADFEWQFSFAANSTSDVLASFCFNVNENSNISKYSSLKDVFAVTLYGSNYTKGAAHDQVDSALCIQYPRAADGDLRAYGYDNVDITPDDNSNATTRIPNLGENGYIKLDDNSADSAINVNLPTTVNIKLVGQKLTVSVWNIEDKAGTYRETVIEHLYDSAFARASSGDFAIVAGGTATVANATNIGIYNMTIKTLAKDIVIEKTQEPDSGEDTPPSGGEDENDSTPENGIYYSNDFEENTDGIKMLTTPKEAELTGVMEEANGNHYYQMSYADSTTNARGGWTTFEITPDEQYKDFTLNFKVKLDPDINPKYNVNDQFMLIAFHSQNGINKANILEIGAKGADFSVADNTNNKTYTNNRIAYAGNKTGTYGKGFDLPDEYYPAGISADDAWYRVSLVVEGWTYKYYLNGELMMETTDPEKLYDKGKIRITCCRLNIQIDDVQITTNDVEIGPFEHTQESTGLLYENTFENAGDDARLTVVAGTDYGLVKDQNGNTYYHINYKRSETNEANGSMRILFGPTGVKNFTLNIKVRITKEVSDKWHSVIPMGRINSGFYLQSRIFTKGSYMLLQDENVTTTAESEQGKLRMPEISRTGPAAANTTSTNPCHDKAYGMSVFEWHKVSFVAEDFKYTLYIDGIKILEGTDIYQLTEYGGFGLRSEGVDLDIDDIKIWGTPHYDLSYTEEVPTGDLYANDFEAENSLDSINFIYYDDDKSKVMSEEDGNKYLRVYPNTDVKEDGKLVVTGNGNMMFSFGPPNAMDFELTYKMRMKSNTNENVGSAIVGIHSDPSLPKWNTVWFNILARGTSVSLKDNSRKLGIDNLIATTGQNRNGGTAYMPSDNREYGIRPDGKWHDIKVICKGYTYTLYVDGKEYLSATDADKTFYKGYTVIGSNGCILDIDNIKLTNK